MLPVSCIVSLSVSLSVTAGGDGCCLTREEPVMRAQATVRRLYQDEQPGVLIALTQQKRAMVAVISGNAMHQGYAPDLDVRIIIADE